MRRFVQFGILSLLLVGVVGLGGLFALAADKANPTPTLPDPTAVPENHGFDPALEKSATWMGVATCASTSCHGENGHEGAPRSEYTTFKGADPHARAFGALYLDRSDHIMHNLYGISKDIKGSAASKDLCLKCHSSYTDDDQKVGERFSRNDGVGCESCHGPAEKWLTTHYEAGFKELSLEEKAALGMRPTKDLLHRTRLCVTCHVGDPNKDVNHDLIAAGHPRLNFEMAGFQAIYPRHWQYADEKARHADFEARLWALGQVVTAKASIELLEARADGAAQGKPNRPWPEFAEYDCYKCHQRLQIDSASQKARWAKPRNPDDPTGSMVWGTWNYSLADLYPEFVGAPRNDGKKALDELRGLMKGTPDEKDVATKAKLVAEDLNGLLLRLRDSKAMSPEQVRGLLNELVDRGVARADSLDWDEAAQLYLGISALHRSLGESNRGASQPIRALGLPLQRAFPPHTDSPTRFDQEHKDLKQRFMDIRFPLVK